MQGLFPVSLGNRSIEDIAKQEWKYLFLFRNTQPVFRLELIYKKIKIIMHCTISLLFNLQSLLLTPLRKKPFENTIGKGENAGNQHFLLFPQCFLPFPEQISIFQSPLFCRLEMLSIWTGLKFCRVVKS